MSISTICLCLATATFPTPPKARAYRQFPSLPPRLVATTLLPGQDKPGPPRPIMVFLIRRFLVGLRCLRRAQVA
jgi:hypothetical protein